MLSTYDRYLLVNQFGICLQTTYQLFLSRMLHRGLRSLSQIYSIIFQCYVVFYTFTVLIILCSEFRSVFDLVPFPILAFIVKPRYQSKVAYATSVDCASFCIGFPNQIKKCRHVLLFLFTIMFSIV